MTDSSDLSLAVLQEMLAQPTAPFHEGRVAARVRAYAREWGIPFRTDETGNIIAHYQRGVVSRPLILMAHMDHPGCTIVAPGGPEGADWTAALEGGVAGTYFERPVAVRLYPRVPGAAGAGLLAHSTGYTRVDAEHSPAGGTLHLYLKLDDPGAAAAIQPDDFGTWELPDFALRDGVIYGRAIDDLVGCAEMLLTLWRCAREEWETDVYAVFTRAEEVGLVGAHAILASGLLPRDGYVVSLEASPALPGAVQGAGPVIRVGDRLTTFSQDAELPLKAAAHRLGSPVWQPSRGRPSTTATARARVQRQLMSGGACEGTAAVLLGYQATGLALPLGNYHNMGEGSVLAPETIHADDYLTGVALLQEAARLMPELDRLRAEHLAAYAPRADQIARLRATTLPDEEGSRSDPLQGPSARA